jgi:hypothetical protein
MIEHELVFARLEGKLGYKELLALGVQAQSSGIDFYSSD